ncbi:MAG: hypothetical protein HYU27_06855 [Acidobacteria bacterium]|nr:hypothetical protein [Acidobacteriota bacterium]
MKAALWMVAASLTVWVGTAAIVDRRTSIEVLYGMLGPLAAACVTGLLAERTYKRNPEKLTRLMTMAFAGKMVFFGAYLGVMLRLIRLRPAPFAVSFVGYLVALYVMEALYLRRLFSRRFQ